MSATRTAFSPDGNQIAAAWGEGTVALWELPSGKALGPRRAGSGAILALAFSPDGQWIATGSQDRSAKVWHVKGYEELLALRGHTGQVTSVAFTADGKGLITGGTDRTVKLWDVSDRRYYGGLRKAQVAEERREAGSVRLPPGSMAHRTFYGHTGPTRNFAFSPDGRHLATADDGDGMVVLWDLSTNTEMRSLPIPKGRTCELAFTLDGKNLLGALGPLKKDPGGVQIWEVESGKTIAKNGLPLGHPTGLVMLPGGAVAVLALACERSTRLAWLGLASGNEQGALELDGLLSHSLGLAADGLLVAGSTGQVTLIDPAKREVLRSFEVKESRGLAVSRDGLVAVGHSDMFVRLYELATGQPVRELEGHTTPVRSVSFSPDGRRLISSGEDKVKIW